MLTDPPTSPAKRMDQIVFGLLTGIISFLTFIIDPGELIYLFVGLLIANVIFFIKSQVYDKKDRKAKRDSAWTGERNVSGARS
jgi:Na+-translocating ferredoxin:NAD+ oxidoreductase RnfD subunit